MKKYLALFFGWSIIISTVVFSVRVIALDADFYLQAYERMDLAKTLHVSDADLNTSIIALLDYLDNKRDTIDVTIKKAQKRTKAFDQREIAHMKDVKSLYQTTVKAGYLCVVFALLLLLYFKGQKNSWAFITKGVLRASLCFFVFMGVLGFWILTDFTDFWIHFHHLFFRNDYWLLTPGVDFMIDMLPESIFNALVVRIVLWVVGVLMCLDGACLYYQRKKAPIGFEDDL